MSTSAQTILNRLRGQLVVSCQAAVGTPLEPTAHIVALAQPAVLGGAKALRVEGIANVRAVRAALDVPIIGAIAAVHSARTASGGRWAAK